MANNETQFDNTGFDAVTSAIVDLINDYPALPSGDKISFSTLGEDYGKSMFPVSGAIIESKDEDITGAIVETCLYPFVIIYRAARLSESRRESVKEWLDNLGRWLDMQPVTIGGTTYTLSAFPELSGDRKFLSFSRSMQSPAYLEGVQENGAEDWGIRITARYQHEYERKD